MPAYTKHLGWYVDLDFRGRTGSITSGKSTFNPSSSTVAATASASETAERITQSAPSKRSERHGERCAAVHSRMATIELQSASFSEIVTVT